MWRSCSHHGTSRSRSRAMVGAALVAGNTIVLKPAEQTPAVGAMVVRALREGGVPDGVVSFLPGLCEEVGAHLAGHPGVSLVAFTGPRQVGLSIVEAAARATEGQREIRAVIADVGGRNTMVIDSDADLDVAVPVAIVPSSALAGSGFLAFPHHHGGLGA